jgi:Spy/CpxP family protein refolding chaperone
MKKLIVGTAVAALACMGTMAWAGPGEGRGDGEQGRGERAMGPGGPQAMGARMLQRVMENPEVAKKLGITEEQAAALQTSFYEQEKKMVALQSEAELAQIEVRRLMDQDDPSAETLMAAIDKAGAARTAIQKASVEQRLAVRKIVGPETMKKIKQQLGERMNKGRGCDDDAVGGRGPRGDKKGAGQDAPWKRGQMQPPVEE